MIIIKRALGRRTFLRGVGATIALPLLDAMVPALSAITQTAANPVRRLGFVFIPMGADMSRFTPPGGDKLVELSPILDPLLPFRNDLTVVTNLQLKESYTPSNGNHANSNCGFLSCVRSKKTEGNDYYLGITVDQIIAQEIGRETTLPSLELGMDLLAQVGACDNGYACAYQNCLSWSSPTTPLAPEADPRVVFERLFGDGANGAERAAERRTNKSILDSVLTDIARLRKKIGPTDRTTVSQYLDSVREIERRIEKGEQRGAESPLPDIERPVSVPASWEEHLKLMFDLQVLVFQADITRVLTFQLAREASSRSYPQIGVPETHHPLSHHQENPVQIAKLAKVNAYHMSLFAYFLEKLKSTPDGDGSLLDHTMYLYGSGMGNPSAHDHIDLPAIVVGGGAGTHKGGRHIRFTERTPMANLHLALLEKMGIHRDGFGDSTGIMREL